MDTKGILHASIKNNVIILEAKQSKLQSLLHELDGIEYLIFTDIGLMYNNNFTCYKSDIEFGKEYQITGIAIYGNESEVNSVTRKFSLCK